MCREILVGNYIDLERESSLVFYFVIDVKCFGDLVVFLFWDFVI